uniref:Uncharacterized protein n=1 Tax=Panagrolaimus sp. JU765 TaxID=591449 RepID=A0AC34RSU7_9BILA
MHELNSTNSTKNIKFGDIFPDSWEIDELQNASLVNNRMFKVLEKENKIWIQISTDSKFVHVYVYDNDSFKYLCKNCKSLGRYSRAKFVKLPNGEDGLFEHQEHSSICRLPLKMFLESQISDSTNNVDLNDLKKNPPIMNLDVDETNNDEVERIMDSDTDSNFSVGSSGIDCASISVEEYDSPVEDYRRRRKRKKFNRTSLGNSTKTRRRKLIMVQQERKESS